MSRIEITTPDELPEEGGTDAALRPSRLDEFVGQEAVKSSLQIAIDAARGRKDTLDHILFFGPPGLGKTTLAQILASTAGAHCVHFSAVTSGALRLMSVAPDDLARKVREALGTPPSN